MIHEFAYPVMLTPDEIEGGFVVTFPDLPEAITQGEDTAGALEEAADALEEAIAGRSGGAIRSHAVHYGRQSVTGPRARVDRRQGRPLPGSSRDRISKSELAARLGCDEKEVRRPS